MWTFFYILLVNVDICKYILPFNHVTKTLMCEKLLTFMCAKAVFRNYYLLTEFYKDTMQITLVMCS